MRALRRWIGFRLDLICSFTLLSAAIIATALRNSVNVALLGLALTYLLQLTGLMQWFVRQTAEVSEHSTWLCTQRCRGGRRACSEAARRNARPAAQVENNMTSAERMLEYTELPQEPPTVAEGGAPPPNDAWPRPGHLVWERVTSRYRPGLPPALRGVSFSLRAGTTCGVVGRTGSGKSSLALTLFRLIEVGVQFLALLCVRAAKQPNSAHNCRLGWRVRRVRAGQVTEGRILLGGVDVSTLGLDALRRRLSIIPQDPVLFSGTVRSNLDPWAHHSDARLWDVLGVVQVRAPPSRLSVRRPSQQR